MTDAPTIEDAAPALRDRADRWRAWLFDRALPLWADRGVNPQGGFFDRLDAHGRPLTEPMRLRVQARQMFVFAEAGRLGWPGDWRRVVEHGLEFLLERATQSGGFVAHTFEPDGSVRDAQPDLYDQAFAAQARLLHGQARPLGAPVQLRPGLDRLEHVHLRVGA